MSQKEQPESRTAIDDINDSLTKAEQRVQNNKKLIMWACIAVAVVVIATLLFIYAYLRPSRNAADTQYGLASNMAANYEMSAPMLDSAATAQQLDAVTKAFEEAATRSHDGGNNAKIMSAIYEFKKGDYNKALTYLNDYDKKDAIIAALSECLKGDCYVNLDKFPEAIECFSKAADLSDENPMVAPYAMMKEATVQRHLKNYSAEAELYEQITTKYPEYGVSINTNIENYLERAKADAAKK